MEQLSRSRMDGQWMLEKGWPFEPHFYDHFGMSPMSYARPETRTYCPHTAIMLLHKVCVGVWKAVRYIIIIKKRWYLHG